MVIRVVLTFLIASSGMVVADDAVFVGETPRQILNSGAGEGPAWDSEWGLLFSVDGNITRWARDGKTSLISHNAG